MKNIEWFLFKGYDGPWGHIEPDEDRCRHDVWDDWYHHQCNRKPKEWIEGYGFCMQHAKMIRERMGRDE